MDKLMTKATGDLLKMIRDMPVYDVGFVLDYFELNPSISIKDCIQAIYANKLDVDLDNAAKVRLSKLKRSVISLARYDISMDDTFIIAGVEVPMEIKEQAVLMIAKYKMPPSNIWFKACVRKLMTTRKGNTNE